MRRRPMLLSLALLGGLACTPKPTTVVPSNAPSSLSASEPRIHAPEIGLPFHGAAIVDVALLRPQTGEQWRLASGDQDGWVRIWADGQLLAVSHAHPRGLTALELADDGRWYTAGADGRVLEWQPDQTTPVRSLALGRPITALAVLGPWLALSDGRYVQLWTRDGEPQLLGTMAAYGFVTGLAFSPDGSRVAAAELREWALEQAVATHPLAPFLDGPDAPSREQQEASRAAAARDFPGAAADFVEVWTARTNMAGAEPGSDLGAGPWSGRSRQLAPRAPIDADIGLLADGSVVYREVYSRDQSALVGRRLGDEAHFALEVIKPWVFWTKANGEPTEASLMPILPVGDFASATRGELLVVDLFPGWGAAPPERSWRVGDRRELATDPHHAALGDGQGNLAVVAWARPAESGWQAPARQQLDQLVGAGASEAANIVTATLEPRTNYRSWSLARGEQRLIRVEPAWQVVPDDASQLLYPAALALDATGQRLAASMNSYAGDGQGAVRVLDVDSGIAQILGLTTSAQTIDIGISSDGKHVLAWAPGAAAQSWQYGGTGKDATWSRGPDALSGVPRFSSDGRWSAHVSAFERHIVDLSAHRPVHASRTEPIDPALGAGSLAAIANDGTLAVVVPFGGGTLELIDAAVPADPEQPSRRIELPGAATALAWVPAELTVEFRSDTPKDVQIERRPGELLVIGFADGTIARLDGDVVTPIDPGVGGRVWALANFGRTGVFAALDDRGLTVHRIDGASLALELADPSLLARYAGSSPQPNTSAGIVAIWRPGNAMPPCVILDGTGLGVLAGAEIPRWPRERGAELFEAFLAGGACPPGEAAGAQAQIRP